MREPFLFRDPTIESFGSFLLEYLDIREVRVKTEFLGGKLQKLKDSYHFPDVKLKPGKDVETFRTLCNAFGFDVEISENGITFTKRQEYCFIEEALKRATEKYQIFVLAPIEVDLVFTCCNQIFVEYEI
jgi:hypothetical protein